MSELKAFRIIQGDTGGYGAPSYKCDTDGNRIDEWSDVCEVYDRFEADKVLADKDAEIAQLQAMLEERNKQVGELKEESRWRKFPDEKPKHNGIFIVLIGKRAKTLDAYDTNKGKFQTYRPTAWMPMPKAPEEAK